MKKILKNAFYWVVLPGLFGLSLAIGDPQLALVGATLLWAIPVILGPLALLALCVMLTMKPGDAKWETNKASVLKDRPGVIRRTLSWVALAATVGLCAYTGFVVTAVFYLIGYLWVRLAYFLMVHHFENAENEKAPS